VGGPRTPQQIAAQKRLQQTQAQVDEVSHTNFTDIDCYINEVALDLAYLMYYIAVGSGHYEDERGEGAGERSETVGTGRPGRLVIKVHTASKY